MTSLQDVFNDPVEFASRLQIQLRDLSLVRFGKMITSAQIQTIDTIANNNRVAITKGRQLGVTTACRAYMVWKVVTTPGYKAGLMSNKRASTKEIAMMDRRFLNTLSQAFGVELVESSNQNELVLKNGSRILYFTASATNDRGYTLSGIHISEFSFAPNASDLLGSILQGIPKDGTVVVESTPSHFGDALHLITENGSGAWTCIFLPWFDSTEYRLPLPENWKKTQEEEVLQTKYGICDEALCWRRWKLSEFSGDAQRFAREYPNSVQDAYALSEGAWLDEQVTNQIKTDTYTEEWEGPVGSGVLVQTLLPHDYRYQYVIGYDPAGGVGQDFSVAVVVCRNTLDVVQVISSNRTSVQDFSDRVAIAAASWKADCIVEWNNHGQRAYNSLVKAGIVASKFNTTARSKIDILELLRTKIHTSLLGTVDHITSGELRSMARQPHGHAPAASVGKHDDRVMALSLALWQDSQLPAIIRQDPWKPRNQKPIQTGRHVPAHPLSKMK